MHVADKAEIMTRLRMSGANSGLNDLCGHTTASGLKVKHMLSLSTSLRSGLISNANRSRVIKINDVNYELHLTNRRKGRLSCHQLVAGTPQLVNVIEIPLNKIELESMFDARTVADILRLAKELGS